MYFTRERITSEGYIAAGTTEGALAEFDRVYAFMVARVGNSSDAEDLTQQVALKALPRLRDGAPAGMVRGYLFTTARSVLGAFWSQRFRLPAAELDEEMADRVDRGSREPSVEAAEWLERTLAGLPPHYRQVLELRFLRGLSISEVAREMSRTQGAVKVMQLRALRAAAAMSTSPTPRRPARRPRAAAPGSASAPPLAVPAASAPPR